MTNMFPIKSQKDGSEFRLCGRNKYVNSLERQDANLKPEENNEDSFKSEGRGSISPCYCETWLAHRFFRACLCEGEY